MDISKFTRFPSKFISFNREFSQSSFKHKIGEEFNFLKRDMKTSPLSEAFITVFKSTIKIQGLVILLFNCSKLFHKENLSFSELES